MTSRTGHRVGPFEVREALGGNSRYSLWRAVRPLGSRPPRVAAVRFSAQPEDRQTQHWIRHEYEILRALGGRGTPEVIGMYSGHGAVAMAYVKGITLADVFAVRAQGHLTIDLATTLDLTLSIARVLRHAHETPSPGRSGSPGGTSDGGRVVHGQLSPSRIRLGSAGEVVLFGFGVEPEGMISGYAPPEQVGAAFVDARSDQWSLGALLVEMILGRRLYERSAAAFAQTGRVEPWISKIEETLPAVARTLRRMLAPAAGDRFASDDALITELLTLCRIAGGVADPARLVSVVQAFRRPPEPTAGPAQPRRSPQPAPSSSAPIDNPGAGAAQASGAASPNWSSRRPPASLPRLAEPTGRRPIPRAPDPTARESEVRRPEAWSGEGPLAASRDARSARPMPAQRWDAPSEVAPARARDARLLRPVPRAPPAPIPPTEDPPRSSQPHRSRPPLNIDEEDTGSLLPTSVGGIDEDDTARLSSADRPGSFTRRPPRLGPRRRTPSPLLPDPALSPGGLSSGPKRAPSVDPAGPDAAHQRRSSSPHRAPLPRAPVSEPAPPLAVMQAERTDAEITHADITHAEITHAEITHAEITHAEITHAEITHAENTSAVPTYAEVTDSEVTQLEVTQLEATQAARPPTPGDPSPTSEARAPDVAAAEPVVEPPGWLTAPWTGPAALAPAWTRAQEAGAWLYRLSLPERAAVMTTAVFTVAGLAWLAWRFL